MKRLTYQEDGMWKSKADQSELLERLACYETMHAALVESVACGQEEMHRMQLDGKGKTLRFKEVMIQKLNHQTLLRWMKQYGLEDE
ncbi:MAG: hypothetical protein ACRDBX_06250 [Erysipelotrichaceae bacterium]